MSSSEEKDKYEGQKSPHLKKVLNAFDLTVIGVAESIGAGIFVFSGIAAARYAGPAVVFSYLIAGICCSFFCASYAEMVAMIPSATGAFTFGTVAFGRLVGWAVGWSLMAEYIFSASAVSVTWSAYFVGLCRSLRFEFPTWLSSSPIGWTDDSQLYFTGNWFDLPAVILISICAGIVMVGVKEFSLATAIILSVKLVTLLVFIIFGMAYVNAENWDPFVPPEESFGHFGWTGVMRASSLVFFAFIGFDAISTAAKESVDPVQDLPIAMFSTLGICTILYCTTALVLTGLVSYTQLSTSDPLIVAVTAAGPGLEWMAPVIQVAVVVGLPSVVVVSIFALSRIVKVMSEEGLVPKVCGELHRLSSTPVVGTGIAALACGFVAALCPVQMIVELASIGTIFALIVVCAAVIRMRDTHPDLPRPFKLPTVAIPAVGIGLALIQACFMAWVTWVRFAVWMAAGGLFYLVQNWNSPAADYIRLPDDPRPDTDAGAGAEQPRATLI